MRTLILNNTENRRFRKDATGAFEPEAFNLQRILRGKGDVVRIGVENKTKKETIEDDVYDHLSLRCFFNTIAFFCHGYRDGIEYSRGDGSASELAHSIASNNPQVENVIFYCCNVCGGDWARVFFEDLNCRVEQDVTVFGHTNSGHTTYNPNIVIYKSWQEPITKKDLIKQHGSIKKLRAALKTDYRFELPFNC